MQYLLDHGAGIDIPRGANIDWSYDFSGDEQLWSKMNALHLAAQYGEKELVEFLLQRGADVNIKACCLDTKFNDISVEDLVRICGHDDIIEMLEYHRASKAR